MLRVTASLASGAVSLALQGTGTYDEREMSLRMNSGDRRMVCWDGESGSASSLPSILNFHTAIKILLSALYPRLIYSWDLWLPDRYLGLALTTRPPCGKGLDGGRVQNHRLGALSWSAQSRVVGVCKTTYLGQALLQ